MSSNNWTDTNVRCLVQLGHEIQDWDGVGRHCIDGVRLGTLRPCLILELVMRLASAITCLDILCNLALLRLAMLESCYISLRLPRATLTSPSYVGSSCAPLENVLSRSTLPSRSRRIKASMENGLCQRGPPCFSSSELVEGPWFPGRLWTSPVSERTCTQRWMVRCVDLMYSAMDGAST